MKAFLRWLQTPIKGSNSISFLLRRKLEKLSFREILGINLAGLAFFGAVVLPQTQEAATNVVIYFDTQQTTVDVVPTASQFRWPLTSFGISQYFSLGHPGIDLTDPIGTPIYPVADGRVQWVVTLPWGYGRHVLVAHANRLQSLYAHMSKVEVTADQAVTKQTEIGEVGNTGWATGNHLHLEIWQDGVPVNPMEVLPALKKN